MTKAKSKTKTKSKTSKEDAEIIITVSKKVKTIHAVDLEEMRESIKDLQDVCCTLEGFKDYRSIDAQRHIKKAILALS